MTNDQSAANGKKTDVASLSISMAVSITMILISIVFVDTLYVGRMMIPEWFRWVVVAIIVWLGTGGYVGLSFALLVAFVFIRSLLERLDASTGACVTLSVLGLGWLMWIARYEAIRRYVTGWLTNFANPSTSSSVPIPETSMRIRILQFLAPISVVLLLMLLPVLATMALYNQPWNANYSPWLEWTLAYGQVLWPGPLLVALLIGALVILNELFWRQKTSQQMQLYARSDAIKSMVADLNRIVARKQRKK